VAVALLLSKKDMGMYGSEKKKEWDRWDEWEGNKKKKK
jgi:hypothetical protein